MASGGAITLQRPFEASILRGRATPPGGHVPASPWLGIASVCFGLLVWYLLGALQIVSSDLLASPGDVLRALDDMLRNGYRETTLQQNVIATIGRCLIGFAFAVVTGIPLGLWMGTSRTVAGAAGWIIQFMRPLPPLSYLVLLILWFGAGDMSKIVLLFLAAFPTITIAAMAGVRQVSTLRVQAAQSLGATKRQIFLYVVFPSALSMIFTGLRIALSGAFSSVVAAELMAASNGIGWMIFSASRFLRNDVIMLGIIILGLFGMTLSRGLVLLDNRLVHWRGRE
jgi:taurine transport system permease protein